MDRNQGKLGQKKKGPIRPVSLDLDICWMPTSFSRCLQRGSAESGWVFDGRRVFSCVADIVRFDTVRVGVHVGLDSGRQRAGKVG